MLLVIVIVPPFLIDPSFVKTPPPLIASVVPDGIMSTCPEDKVAVPVTVQVEAVESHDPKLALVDEFNTSLIDDAAAALENSANRVDSKSTIPNEAMIIKIVNLVLIERSRASQYVLYGTYMKIATKVIQPFFLILAALVFKC